MRPIDADALRDKFQREIDKVNPPFDDVFGSIRCGVRLARNMLEDEPTIDTEPHWILCGEGLPEKDGYYLTTTCYGQVYCDFWNTDHFDRTEVVIAWMPLPKPYEVE